MYFESPDKLAQLVWHSLPSPGTPTQLHQLVVFFTELYERVQALEDIVFVEDEP